MEMQQSKWDTLIVGLGKTGLSVARYLRDKDVTFAVADSRVQPPGIDALKEEFPEVDTYFGAFDEAVFVKAKQLIVSPGIAVAIPEIKKAKAAGAEIIGDIELFAREVKTPVITITGSNGKTTVTMLMSMMAEKAGKRVLTGGNVGTPVLELLEREAPDLYVLELSSFQLETTDSLNAISAVILNISEDHMDRYTGMDDYAAAKGHIYDQCETAVVNREDAKVIELAGTQSNVTFGLDEPEEGQFGVREKDGQSWLAKGQECLMPASEMKLPGTHNIANALAALALGDLAGLSMQGMLAALRTFTGLEHRTQWVKKIHSVNWYNDSKGTNVGATIAALSGLPGKTVLIAGGQGKGSDFNPLAPVVKRKARAVVLIGEDAHQIADALNGSAKKVYAKDMEEAVKLAAELAEDNDNVLLSPACASFDMFSNYEERGYVFMDAVRRLEA
jgi:UDP-N-acetylmuramoylalanine--D-glutamate ligase